MSDPINLLKVLAGTVLASVAVPGAVDAIERAERMILGVPQSVLMVSLAGALIGVLLLPEKDADRVTPDAGRTTSQRALQLSTRMLALALAVAGYALIAAWVIAIAGALWPALAGAPQLPLAGISGVVIRRMLPKYLKLVERITGVIGGGRTEP